MRENELGTGTEKFAVPNRLVPPELSSGYGIANAHGKQNFSVGKTYFFIARATRRA